MGRAADVFACKWLLPLTLGQLLAGIPPPAAGAAGCSCQGLPRCCCCCWLQLPGACHGPLLGASLCPAIPRWRHGGSRVTPPSAWGPAAPGAREEKGRGGDKGRDRVRARWV